MLPRWPLLCVFLLTPLLGAGPRGRLLVCNQGDHTLTVIDTATNAVTATIAENAVTGHEVVASPDGHLAFVPIYGNSGVGRPGLDGSTMLVVDLSTNQVVHTVDFGRGLRPHCARYDATSGNLFITTELARSIAIVDPNSWRIIGQVPTGAVQSHMLILSHDGRRGYTSNVGPGSVSALDLVGRKTLAVIPVATHVQRIAISNDDRWVFTSDTEQPRLAVIDAPALKVDGWINLPANGYGALPTRDGKSLLVALPLRSQIASVDLATRQVTRTLTLPGLPQEILLSPDGRLAYVSCFTSPPVAVVDLASWKVTAEIPVGKKADGLAWANVPDV